MSKKYLIAGMVTDIAYKFPYTANMLKNYEYFGDNPVQISARITVEDFLAEAKLLKGESDDFIENSAILRKLSNVLLDYGAMLFHGSTVKYNGNAFVFTAPSGTGKSTHTALLKQLLGDKLCYINDDKPILKVENGKVIAYGSPWNGKHNLGENVSAPLKAICVVTRANENSISKVSPEDFIKVLFEQSVGFDNAITANKVLDVLDVISKTCKFNLLKCNMDISAAKCSLEGMLYED
jgi:hypothetical protein